MSGNENETFSTFPPATQSDNVLPSAAGAANPVAAVHPATMVTIPDPNGSKQVTVTLATHQIMASAGSYSFRSVDFNVPHQVLSHAKRVREFLKTQEAIVGADAIKVVLKPFMKSILRGTVLKSSFSIMWEEAAEDWEVFLQQLVSDVGQLSANEHLQLALDLVNYCPPPKTNLRLAILHFAGEIRTLSRKQFSYVPHQAILSNRLLKFVPVSYQHVMDAELKDPSGGLSLDEYIDKLRKFALLINPKVQPNSIQDATPSRSANSGRPNNHQANNNNRRDNGQNQQGQRRNNPQNGPGNGSSSTPNSSSQSNNSNSSSNNGQNRPANSGNSAAGSTSNGGNQSYNRSGPKANSSFNRPPPISLFAPSSRPAVPQPASGDVSMSGNTKPSVGSSSALPLSSGQQLGRLTILEPEQGDYRIWARVDSGADDHIAGKDVLGHGVPDGRHESLFAVPLQRKALAADCVKVTGFTETGDALQFRGVISPSTSTCLRPTSLSYDSENPDPTRDYAIINGLRLPVHVRNHSPYVLLTLQPATSKSKRDFCTMLGYADDPLPSDKELVEFIHVKFACAGAHTIDLSCRIWGYPIPFDTIRNSIATCPRCPATDTFDQVSTVMSDVAALEHVSPLCDVLVFDTAEMPFISARGNKHFLVAKLVRCGRYFVRPGGRSSAADHIIKIITHLRIPVVACYSDRSRDFSRVQNYCGRNNIAYNPSHLGRDEYKGHQESAVSHAKAIMEWFFHNWDFEDVQHHWEMCAYAAEHVLNTRASPSRYLIPFHVCHGTRPRYDLFPLSVVTWVKGSKRLSEQRTEPVVFLCQINAQSAMVWRFSEQPNAIAEVHVNSLRTPKFNSNNLDAFLKPIVDINA